MNSVLCISIIFIPSLDVIGRTIKSDISLSISWFGYA